MQNALLVFLSETVLSAYPSLIKLVDASVFFQTGLRMIMFTVLAGTAAYATKNPLLAANFASAESIWVGLMNLLHVSSSYTAFDQLAGGNAMAIFYTYPVWNILGAAALLKESIPLTSLPWIAVAFVGAILLAQPAANQWTLLGVCAALVAALTETGIYLWFRHNHNETRDADQPWTNMIQLYGSSALFWILGAVVLGAFGMLANNVFRLSGAGLTGILLFNAIVGFVGYALRFYLIPKVPTVVFSALSFVGIIAAYLFGWAFTSEVPSLLQAAGAVAIIVANTVLVKKETV